MAIKKIKASIRQVINYGWVVKNIPFFLFLSGLAVLYIANGHYADKTIRNINATSIELKELQYEYKTVKSEMMYKSREAEMVGAAAPLGLKISPEPPMQIIIDDNKQQNTEK